jgi:hypothetical protein
MQCPCCQKRFPESADSLGSCSCSENYCVACLRCVRHCICGESPAKIVVRRTQPDARDEICQTSSRVNWRA